MNRNAVFRSTRGAAHVRGRFFFILREPTLSYFWMGESHHIHCVRVCSAHAAFTRYISFIVVLGDGCTCTHCGLWGTVWGSRRKAHIRTRV